jgi:formate dehydrogenase (coenzyme F420) beta subunit
VPLVPLNSARLVAERLRKEPFGQTRLGAVLRSCEARALFHVVSREGLNLDGWLIISVDCLASFPLDEEEWRLEKAGTVEHLTREALRFARQGGIAPYRFRQACQMCPSPLAPEADLTIGLLGLPVREYLLVGARDEALAERLRLYELTRGLAPETLVAQRKRLADRLEEQHAATRQAMLAALAADLPDDPNELLAYLENCAPCQACLEVCPVYTGELEKTAGGNEVERVLAWLSACVKCGMCEQACPKHMPLAAIHTRLSQRVNQISFQ